MHRGREPVYTRAVNTPLRLARTSEGVAAQGEVDLATADRFCRELEAAAEEATGRFTIDLSGITFMDSAGLVALIRVAERSSRLQVIVLPSIQIYTLLDLAGFTKGGWENVTVCPPDEGSTGRSS